MSSNLGAEVQDLSYMYVLGSELHFDSVEAKSIQLDDIADACIQNPSAELEKSILTGMKFPVIVVDNTLEEYNKAVVGLSNKNDYDPTKKYLVLIGNQRVTIARKYFSSVDAFIVDKGIKAIFIKHTYEDIHGKL